MKSVWLCIALAFQCLLAAAASAGPRLAPHHVMSLSLCTDALLLSMLPPDRIASVTYLAHQSTDPTLAAEAARVGINYGSPEEVLAQAPDLILAADYSTPDARRLLRQLHEPLLVIPNATSFAGIRANVTSVARVLGVQQRGRALLTQMDVTLAQVRRNRPTRPIRVAGWEGDGYVPGRDSLFNAILQAAGGINVAATTGDRLSVSFDIEQLLMADPQVLAQGDEPTAPALRTDTEEFPLLLRLFAGRRITYPQLPVECGLPRSAQAARQLQDEMLAVVHSLGRASPIGGMP